MHSHKRPKRANYHAAGGEASLGNDPEGQLTGRPHLPQAYSSAADDRGHAEGHRDIP